MIIIIIINILRSDILNTKVYYYSIFVLFIYLLYKYDMILVIIYVTQCLACIDWYIYIIYYLRSYKLNQYHLYLQQVGRRSLRPTWAQCWWRRFRRGCRRTWGLEQTFGLTNTHRWQDCTNINHINSRLNANNHQRIYIRTQINVTYVR